jgi:hypothetical protein
MHCSKRTYKMFWLTKTHTYDKHIEVGDDKHVKVDDKYNVMIWQQKQKYWVRGKLNPFLKMTTNLITCISKIRHWFCYFCLYIRMYQINNSTVKCYQLLKVAHYESIRCLLLYFAVLSRNCWWRPNIIKY